MIDFHLIFLGKAFGHSTSVTKLKWTQNKSKSFQYPQKAQSACGTILDNKKVTLWYELIQVKSNLGVESSWAFI